MDKSEAKTSVKAIYLQAAALAGFEVSPDSPERLAELVEANFSKVAPKRKGEAVANVLRIVAMTLELAEKRGDTSLHESSVDAGQQSVCPVYPFGGQKAQGSAGNAAKKSAKKGAGR